MKILSVIVPCYNSQSYMEHAILTLLSGGEDVEILLIDDGSADGTLNLAKKYESMHPDIIRVIHQENKGHGGALNTGIEAAAGAYLKVVDSDDWVNVDAYLKILDELKNVVRNNEPLDMLLSNFVYEKQGAKRKKVIHYRHYLDDDGLFMWSDIRGLPVTNYLMMHSIIYRTQLLKKCGLKLPEHTFYVDSLYAFVPLSHVRTIRYMDLNFYRYFIGREGQSVQEKVMLTRLPQHERVTKLMIDAMVQAEPDVHDKALRKTMRNNLALTIAVDSIMSMLEDTKENRQNRKNIWMYLRESDKKLYRKIRMSPLGMGVNMPGWLGRKAAVGCYHLLQRLYGFN
ncbi:glycosyltransferase family 2 protein [Murimonas intestini]|uniref:glycosyltransferase family 2 protein n=2 Tax=Murimonas intestini TaxID=1337051 RepID=UPI0011DDC959|nr:glycosyltransferase family 2 protein [Murimonas intestini]